MAKDATFGPLAAFSLKWLCWAKNSRINRTGTFFRDSAASPFLQRIRMMKTLTMRLISLLKFYTGWRKRSILTSTLVLYQAMMSWPIRNRSLNRFLRSLSSTSYLTTLMVKWGQTYCRLWWTCLNTIISSGLVPSSSYSTLYSMIFAFPPTRQQPLTNS